MKNYQDDKYENFMANLRASRPVLAAFASYTVAAVSKPGVDKLIVAQLAGLVAARTAFDEGLVARTAGSGSSQSGTGTEQDAFDAFKAFVTDTNTRHLQPYFLDHAEAESLFYPDKLRGLTQAPKARRPARLTAYTEALEAAPAALPATLAPQARALLTAYSAAAAAKTVGRVTLQATISGLGPDAEALAEALWDVHTAALFVHRRSPRLARKYFDYASLPGGEAPHGSGPANKLAPAPPETPVG